MPAPCIDEQLNLLKSARTWLLAPANKHGNTNSKFRWEWLSKQQLLVVEFRHGEQTQRVFLSGWLRHCRWAVEQAGQLQVMPPHVDPVIPVFNADVAWAQSWRDTIPRDVLEAIEPFAIGRWPMLYWASRSPLAMTWLRQDAQLLWLLLMTANEEDWSSRRIEHALEGSPQELLRACGVGKPEKAYRVLARLRRNFYSRDSYRRLINHLRLDKNPAAQQHEHELANPVSSAFREPDERALAMFIVCPETLDDVTQALAQVVHSDFEKCLRLVLLPDPLAHEGAEKQHLNRLAAALLKPRVDAVIHINSQRLAEELGTEWYPELVQTRIHETLTQCVRSISETIQRVGLMGVDFIDVRNCLQQQGDAWVAIGEASGTNRATVATQQAVRSLQIDCALHQSQSIMACVTGGMDMEIQEFDQVSEVIESVVPKTTHILLSSVIDPDMPVGQLQVMILVAGISVRYANQVEAEALRVLAKSQG